MTSKESELNKLKGRQAWQRLALEGRQVVESRDVARKEGLLASTPEELDKNLKWEMKPHVSGGYKVAYGYDAERKEDPAEAYFCRHCDGWVKGEPDGEPYDSIGPLAGSKGVNFNCKVCDLQIGAHIEKMS